MIYYTEKKPTVYDVQAALDACHRNGQTVTGWFKQVSDGQWSIRIETSR